MTPLRSTHAVHPVLLTSLDRRDGYGSITLQVRRAGSRLSAQLTLLLFIDGKPPLCEHIIANHLLDVPDTIILAAELSDLRFPCGIPATPTLLESFFAAFPEV